MDAIDHAVSIGARVTNNSNQYAIASGAIESAYAQSRAMGLVHFASAGNFAVRVSTYPASLPTVNSIGAVDRTGSLASFSNFGTTLFATAPGEEIITTDRVGSDGQAEGDYTAVDGTSFASPYAAGVAALVLSLDPSLEAAEVEAILAETAADYGAPGFDAVFGWGLLNARAAVERATGGCDADLAAPYGILDLADVQGFLSFFLNEEPGADFAEPFGILDLSDVTSFASAFIAGCP